MSIRNLANTPGPWEAIEFEIIDQNNERIAHSIARYKPDEELLANAKLMAGSPDMFDICEELANINWDLLGPRTFEKLQNKAKQIIIKIEGGQ